MNLVVQPFTFLAGTQTLGSLDPQWRLDQAPDGGSERAFRTHVRFTQAFRQAPLVHAGIAGFDIAPDEAARLTVTTDQVTPEGFDIVVSTWRATRLWRVDVNWLAIGA